MHQAWFNRIFRERVPDLMELEELAGLATGLSGSLARDRSVATARREYLQGEVEAMRTTLRILQGEAPGFVEEVQSLCGIAPSWTEGTAFEEAHRALDDLIPGSGPLADKLNSFRD